MINGLPSQPLNPSLANTHPVMATSEKDASTSPTIIQSPSLGKWDEPQPLGQLTKKSKLTTDQYYTNKYPKYTNSQLLLDNGHIKITHKTT
ncbi:hypothetical protein HZF02_06845 [Pseudomonas yamanorum]|nr:hypothetical protein HZF02_06845 [Pseudomonas yamanorum]